MTLAQQAARNRANLENQAQLPHDERFDRMYRAERNWMLLVLSILVAIAFSLSMDVIASLDDGAKPGKILAKSEMTQAEVNALHIIGTQAEKRGNHGR